MAIKNAIKIHLNVILSNNKKEGFKSLKTIKKTSITIKTNKKYIKVRAYVISNKKKIYAPYSNVK